VRASAKLCGECARCWRQKPELLASFISRVNTIVICRVFFEMMLPKCFAAVFLRLILEKHTGVVSVLGTLPSCNC
jgi:hypothetical protein